MICLEGCGDSLAEEQPCAGMPGFESQSPQPNQNPCIDNCTGILS